MEDLERQLAELEALASIYPGECEVDGSGLRCVEVAAAGAYDVTTRPACKGYRGGRVGWRASGVAGCLVCNPIPVRW
jgi:hypothetical protein